MSRLHIGSEVIIRVFCAGLGRYSLVQLFTAPTLGEELF